jgi:hypothetical protein
MEGARVALGVTGLAPLFDREVSTVAGQGDTGSSSCPEARGRDD